MSKRKYKLLIIERVSWRESTDWMRYESPSLDDGSIDWSQNRIRKKWYGVRRIANRNNKKSH